MSESGALTPTQDPLTGPFWTAAGEGRLVVQRCESCGELRWPPLSGWSQVTYHRAFQAELKADIPYTVALVQLDDGPYLAGRLAPGATAAIGDRVTAEFAEVRGAPQLRWRPLDDSADDSEQQHANGGSDGKA